MGCIHTKNVLPLPRNLSICASDSPFSVHLTQKKDTHTRAKEHNPSLSGALKQKGISQNAGTVATLRRKCTQRNPRFQRTRPVCVKQPREGRRKYRTSQEKRQTRKEKKGFREFALHVMFLPHRARIVPNEVKPFHAPTTPTRGKLELHFAQCTYFHGRITRFDIIGTQFMSLHLQTTTFFSPPKKMKEIKKRSNAVSNCFIFHSLYILSPLSMEQIQLNIIIKQYTCN
jgi:hypothetical protein